MRRLRFIAYGFCVPAHRERRSRCCGVLVPSTKLYIDEPLSTASSASEFASV
jgi:hypothetical protein